MTTETEREAVALTIEQVTGLRREILTQLNLVTAKLIKSALWLADDMTTLARRLTNEPNSSAINSLGEVQGHGPAIDALCGRRSSLLAVLRSLDEAGKS